MESCKRGVRKCRRILWLTLTLGQGRRWWGSGRATDAAVLRRIIEVIEMQPEENFMRKYYTDEAWERRSQLRQEIPSETL